MRRYATFVVRILLDQDDSVLGGQISSTSTQKTIHFRDFEKAIAFIQEHVGAEEEQRGDKSNGTTTLPGGDHR